VKGKFHAPKHYIHAKVPKVLEWWQPEAAVNEGAAAIVTTTDKGKR
jgi:hypothetical protein